MKAHHFILGNDKVTLWRNHVSELKEQISEIMRLMTMGDAGTEAGEEEGRVNLWRSRRHDVFRAARDQKLPVCLSCRTENAAGQAEEQLLSAQVLRGDPLTLELLDAPPELLLASDFCSYTFTIQEEEARLEVSGTATIRELQRRADGLRVIVGLLRRPSVRPVIDPPALIDCSCPSSSRLVLVNSLPRTLQALRALLRQTAEDDEDTPRLHTMSPTGATFQLSPGRAAQWARSFENFLVLFIPHFGNRQNIFIFQARKTAVNRMDGGGSLMQLRFERSLKLDDDMKLQWLPLDRKGSKRLYRLVREMAEGLASSRS